MTIDKILCSQKLSPRPARGHKQQPERWELRLCPDCHYDFPKYVNCDHCDGTGWVLVPPLLLASERRERNWRWLGIAVIAGIIVAGILLEVLR